MNKKFREDERKEELEARYGKQAADAGEGDEEEDEADGEEEDFEGEEEEMDEEGLEEGDEGMEEDDDRRLVACRLNATRWAVAVGLFNDGGDSWTR